LPAFERCVIDARRRRRRGDGRPFGLADQQRGLGKRGDLAGVVAMEVADADELDLLWLDVELRELVDDARLRAGVRRARRKTGVPQHVIVAMLDDVAAVDELDLLVAVLEI